MEEFSVQPLSEGLGFYEKKPIPDSLKRTEEKQALKGLGLVLGQKPAPLLSPLPEDFLSEKGDPQKKETYDELRILLEKPYLNQTGPRVRGDAWRAGFAQQVSPFEKDASLKAFPSYSQDRKQAVPASIQPAISPTQMSAPHEAHTPFRTIFHSFMKAVLTDALTASLFFFPPFLLFMLLTEAVSISVLGLLWPQILLAFLFFVQIYCLLCRLFCFETCGEALAKIRLSSRKSKGPAHPLSLFWRFLLSCFTGFVFLPLLSFLFQKDLTGRFTGLYFQKV